MIVVDTFRSPFSKLRPVPLHAITLTDEFWAPRLTTLREVALPAQLVQIEQTGRLDNFRRAAGWVDTPRRGFVYDDSDVYKWLEAFFWSSVGSDFSRSDSDATSVAATNPEGFAIKVEKVIETVLAAQQPDGYLNTNFLFDKASQRWSNIRDWHELYCAGHFIQAAIAHYRVMGDDRLLTAACKFADLICATFGPLEQGKTPTAPGHQEVELALVELYRVTDKLHYLQQAQYFLDARGHGLIGGSPYHQDHKPYRQLDCHAGHAVRAIYMNIAAADLYAESGDPALLETLTRLWEHTTTRQMYITGGFGARHSGESFGDDYELPNRQAYAETCAAIASVMWNYRMVLITGEARYTDLLEHTLYNGVLPGISIDSQHYFYVNPLSDEGEHRRQPWFPCACCPPNLARLLASLPGYFYSISHGNLSTDMPLDGDSSRFSLWIHLYAENTLRLTLPDGKPIILETHTQYPWQGNVTFTIRGTGSFAIRLRIPGWCMEPTITLNANPNLPPTPGLYYEIFRTWEDGDTVTLNLPMPVRFMESNPAIAENNGKVALQRGPILYCLETADNPGFDLNEIFLHLPPPSVQYFPEKLGGLTALQLQAEHHPPAEPWSHLYRPSSEWVANLNSRITVTAIPYCAWANREPGQMRVWMRTISNH